MSFELSNQFRWRTNGGPELLPQEMDTHHLYYTLRMIWNHTVPAKHHFPCYRRYTFDPSYTKDYLLQAIPALLEELSKRTDILPSWKVGLNFMMKRAEMMRQEKLNAPIESYES